MTIVHARWIGRVVWTLAVYGFISLVRPSLATRVSEWVVELVEALLIGG